jgi:branched-chain amino acid transport system substrate-binding protein
LVICSYPLDTVGMIKTINEIGFKPKMWGGAMVGLQATAFKTLSRPGCRSSRWNFPDRWSS